MPGIFICVHIYFIDIHMYITEIMREQDGACSLSVRIITAYVYVCVYICLYI